MSETTNPTVSICIASFNHADFLAEMLESLLAQTFRDFEIVIVDDGSTDDSLEILKNFAQKLPCLTVFTHQDHVNKGISETLNLAIERSKGEFIAFLGSDDMLYPDALEHQVKRLSSDPDLAFVYGKCTCVDELGNTIDKVFGSDVVSGPDGISEVVLWDGIPSVTVMARKAPLYEFGLFEKNLVFSDWNLWVKILAHYDVGFIDRFLTKYRVHGKNTSIGIQYRVYLGYVLANLNSLNSEQKKIGGRLLEHPNLIKTGLKNTRMALANSFLDSCLEYLSIRNKKKALESLRDAGKAYPYIFFRFRRMLALVKRAMLS